MLTRLMYLNVTDRDESLGFEIKTMRKRYDSFWPGKLYKYNVGSRGQAGQITNSWVGSAAFVFIVMIPFFFNNHSIYRLLQNYP